MRMLLSLIVVLCYTINSYGDELVNLDEPIVAVEFATEERFTFDQVLINDLQTRSYGEVKFRYVTCVLQNSNNKTKDEIDFVTFKGKSYIHHRSPLMLDSNDVKMLQKLIINSQLDVKEKESYTLNNVKGYINIQEQESLAPTRHEIDGYVKYVDDIVEFSRESIITIIPKSKVVSVSVFKKDEL